jgi:hypothetical protein
MGRHGFGQEGEYNQRDYYATKQEDVKTELSVEGKKLPEIDPKETRLRFSSGLKLREEEFGGVIQANSQPRFVNKVSYSLLTSLKRKEKFTPNSVAKEFRFPVGELELFLAQLMLSGIIDEV